MVTRHHMNVGQLLIMPPPPGPHASTRLPPNARPYNKRSPQHLWDFSPRQAATQYQVVAPCLFSQPPVEASPPLGSSVTDCWQHA